MKNLLKGKTVALVGPSSSLIGSKLGSKIDSYDIVIRVNKGIPIPKHLEEDLGIRCDILCTNLDGDPISSGDITPELWSKIGVNHVFCHLPKNVCGPQMIDHANKIKDHINISFNEDWIYDNITTRLKSSPHTGFSSLIYILSSELSELYLVGYSFYKDLPYEEYYHGKVSMDIVINDINDININSDKCRNKNMVVNGHDNYSEFELFKNEIYPYDSRITIDNNLNKFIQI
jgi:hypothetical protein